MSLHSIRNYLLTLRIAMSNIGFINVAASAIFLLGMVGQLWLIPKMNRQSDLQQIVLANIERRLIVSPSPPAAPLSLAEKRLTDFYSVLGNKDGVEQYVKTSLLLAQDSGLVLSLADYKYSFDTKGNFYTYQITFPLKGSYRSMRQFCEKFLYTFPFASLDEMTFRRDAIASQMVDARIRFTLHISQKTKIRLVEPDAVSVGEEP